MAKCDTAVEKLSHDLLIMFIAQWIAIDHGKTRLQADQYLTDAQELYDYLYVLGFRNSRELEGE
jgi:hypothetical protein